MKFKDLVADPRDGSLSGTKLGSVFGLVALTAAFLKMAWAGSLTWELMLVYGGLTFAKHALMVFLSLRAPQPEPNPPRSVEDVDP